MNNEFTAFLIERIEYKLASIDEASSHEEIERITDETRVYVDKLKNLVIKESVA